jgi:hypothetical protein
MKAQYFLFKKLSFVRDYDTIYYLSTMKKKKVNPDYC